MQLRFSIMCELCTRSLTHSFFAKIKLVEFAYTSMHFADALDLQCMQVIHCISMCFA